MVLSSRLGRVVLACQLLWLSLLGCITPAEEQQIKDDIFGLQ